MVKQKDNLRPLNVYLAEPRGFCAGVRRAIQIVKQALERYGAPVYVRHHIVHNQYVVDSLRKKGVIFVDELDQCPNDRPIIFSAHGVSSCVINEAVKRNMHYIDATCPLVSKVHREAEYYSKNNYHILFIGHQKHPEVIGTIGRVPRQDITLIQSEKDFVHIPPKKKLALITQTTLAVNETRTLINQLKKRYPNIHMPNKEDICYATTNRQQAVYEISKKVDAVIVIGDPASSNSKRLVDISRAAGCNQSFLVRNAHEVNMQYLKKIKSIGITASASAPEILVMQIISSLQKHFHLLLQTYATSVENTIFKPPKI